MVLALRNSAPANAKRIKILRIEQFFRIVFVFGLSECLEFRRLKKTALTVFACFKRIQQCQMPMSNFLSITVEIDNGSVFRKPRRKRISGRSSFRVPVRFTS